MLSPARRHMLRVSASEVAQQQDNPLRHATGYELMLVQLADDRRKLKQIFSKEKKAEHKRAMLPAYAPWVAGVLASGNGVQDEVLMTVMLWRLDVGDIPAALEIARYALPHRLVMPGKHHRATPYALVEEVALAAQRLQADGQAVNVGDLLDTLSMTENADMPDVVRAQLHKVIGQLLESAGENDQALTHLKRAMQLDKNAGVKKNIERVERALKPAPVKAKAEPAKNRRPRTSKAKPKAKTRAKPAAKAAASATA